MIAMREHRCTDVPVCPHCGHEHHDWGDWYVGSSQECVDVDCESCEKGFVACMQVNPTFNTYKGDDDAPIQSSSNDHEIRSI
jgi:hypothetical protein